MALASGDADGTVLFHVPSDSYSIINPTDVYAPLEDILRSTDLERQSLGEVVFGEMRQYRSGGEVHMDVMFDGLDVTLPGRSEPITTGVTSGYDFFVGYAVYVEGVRPGLVLLELDPVTHIPGGRQARR